MIQATPRERPHLFLAVLGWKLSPFHAQSREALVLACAQQGVDLTIHPDMTSGVDRARNISIELARTTDCTHFMFIDSDLAFDPADVLAMLATGFDVVGGAYPKKHINWRAVVEAVKAGKTAEELPEYANDFVGNAKGRELAGSVDPTSGARYLEVEELGTGFLMLRRGAIERYIERWRDEIAYLTDYEPRGVVHHMVFACERDPAAPLMAAVRGLLDEAAKYAEAVRKRDGSALPWELADAAMAYREELSRDHALGRYLTEDYSFCRRWRMLGGKVMLALDATLVHQGPFLFQGHLGHQYEQKAQAAE